MPSPTWTEITESCGSGGVAGDELNDGPAVRGLESGDPAHVEPLDAEPEVVHVEVASFANVWDGQVRGDAGGLHERFLLSVAARACHSLAFCRHHVYHVRTVGWTLGRVLQNALCNIEDGEPALDEQRAIAEALDQEAP